MLRCIRCNAGSNKVALSEHFFCVDTINCTIRQEAKKQVVKINFDAACLGNNAAGGCPLGIGVYVIIDGIHAPEWCGTKPVKWGSNNDGEYIGLICALFIATQMLKVNPKFVFSIWGDSQIVVNGYNGQSKVAPKFAKYLKKADKLKRELGKSLLAVRWCRREQNKEADILSKEALKLHT